MKFSLRAQCSSIDKLPKKKVGLYLNLKSKRYINVDFWKKNEVDISRNASRVESNGVRKLRKLCFHKSNLEESSLKNMENHVFGFFMKNIVFYIYLGIVKYTYTV